MVTVSKKLQAIIEEQNGIFIDRAEEIRAAWCAALALEHLFLLGPWGVAKSMLIKDQVRRILGARLFDYLMFKDTTRTELIGPPSVRGLKDDRYEYILDHGIANAHIAFLDEIWKAGSSILNSVLGVTNERELKNGTAGTVTVPLISLYCASNEMPESEEVAALWDRILIRMQVRDLESDTDFLQLLKSRPNLNNGNPTTLTLAELEQAQGEAAKVVIPDDVMDLVVQMRRQLRDNQIKIYPRRWLKGLKVIQANAYMAGKDEAEAEDLEMFQHMLWETTDQISKVKQIVYGICNPVRMEILALIDKAEDAYREVKTLERTNPTELKASGKAMENQQKLKRIGIDLKKMMRDRKMSDNASRECGEAIKRVDSYNREITVEYLGITL